MVSGLSESLHLRCCFAPTSHSSFFSPLRAQMGMFGGGGVFESSFRVYPVSFIDKASGPRLRSPAQAVTHASRLSRTCVLSSPT